MPPPRPRGFASSSGGSNTRPAPNTPMSERQQMALLMQMTSSAASPSSTSSSELSPGSSTHTPARSRDRNERGETSLHVAAIKGDQDAVKKLLESGVSPNVADFAGWTPLHEACNHAHYNVALTLVKAGANVNAKGLDDDTPLHDAATIGHLKLVKMLVEKGADINFKNRKGKTAVDIAHSSVASYLQSVRDSPANRAAQQMKKAEQKKNIDDTDDSIPNTLSTSQPTSGAGNKEEDDIYEFKSTPKDSSSGSGSEDTKNDNRKNEKRSTSEEKNSEDTTTGIGCNNSGNISVASNSSNITANSAGSSSTSGVSGNSTIGSGSSGTIGATKRSYSDIEGHDDTSTDGDEVKKKKRCKDGSDNIKESNKQGLSGRNTQSQRTEKNIKQSGGSGKSTGSITGKTSSNLDRKSPCASPKPSSNKNADSDNETDDNKGSENFGNNGGPKVPPLKIVIPQQNNSGDNENSSRNGKNNSTRNHPALPYVVASSSNSNDSVAADRESASSRCASPADSTGKNSTSSLAVGDEKISTKATSEERAQQRVLRSSHRGGVGGQSVDRGSNNSSPQLQSSSPSPAAPNEKEENSTVCVSNTNVGNSTSNSGTTSCSTNANKSQISTNNPSPANNAVASHNSQADSETNAGNVPSPSASSTSSTSKEVSQANVELHPRKRKIRANKQDDSSNKTSNTQSNQANSSESTSTVNEIHPHDHPFTNCYQMYLNIRKQIDKKHKSLMPIQPRPPQGFKDYLLNRKTYALAGKTSIEPIIDHPINLPTQMKDLFTTQERERYKLKMQHIVEREKLGLTVEQEILRVHAKAARSLACQSLPLSACTILKDEEVYNMITPEQEEKDRNARSRYNGRLFLSWLQDVDDKWEKIKESMLLRHHNEAESLHAVQKMDWEWLMKEHSLCDYKSQPVIDESHVPMVHVSDDFDLLPA